MFAILRGAKGRRHEVDFKDDPVIVDVSMSTATVQITMTAARPGNPATRRLRHRHVATTRRRRLPCSKHRPLDIFEQHASARAQMPRHALVECCDAVTDRVVQLGDREQPAIAQLGDDPARGQQHGHPDFGFVALSRHRLSISLPQQLLPETAACFPTESTR
jgi:hypothetical protein